MIEPARIRTVDPTDDDFSDLAPVAASIGDARVVLMGEQTHADGLAFLAKSRLIAFLYAELGFDTIVWEAGVYDCHMTEQRLSEGAIPMDALDRGIHQVWITRELQGLANLTGATWNTHRPLRHAGFDCQFSSRFSWDEVATHLRQWFDVVAPGSMTDTGEARLRALARSSIPFLPQLSEEDRRAARELLQELVGVYEARADDFAAVHGQEPAKVIGRTLTNFLMNDAYTYDSNRFYGLLPGMSRLPAGLSDALLEPEAKRLFTERDQMMASNLLWLTEDLLSGHKAVGWLANGHATRRLSEAACVDDRFDGFYTAGELAHRALGDQVHFIAFDSYDRRSMHDGPRHRPAELETRLHDSGYPFAFLDLRGQPAGSQFRKPMSGQLFGMPPDLVTDWTTVADAVFFVDRMLPSTKR